MPLEFVNPPHLYVTMASEIHWSEVSQSPLPFPEGPIVRCITVDGVTYWYSLGRWLQV